MLAKGVVEQFVKVSLPCFRDDDDEPLPCEATCTDFVHAFAVDF